MTKELIQFLKENLTIEIWEGDCCDSPEINVQISLCGEVISHSSDCLSYSYSR